MRGERGFDGQENESFKGNGGSHRAAAETEVSFLKAMGGVH